MESPHKPTVENEQMTDNSCHLCAKSSKNDSRSLPINEHRSAMAINLRTMDGDAGSKVRERMNSEYGSVALISALLLNAVFPHLVNPPQFFDGQEDDWRFRTFMFATALAAAFNTFSALMCITLRYQLNMMPTDKELGEYIRKLSQLGKGPIASDNGLPDYIILVTGMGGICMVVMAFTALHMSMKTADAWVASILFVGFGYIPFQIFAATLDGWKWRVLRKLAHDQAQEGSFNHHNQMINE